MKRKSLRGIIRNLSTPEALTANYKNMFPGIPDAEAEELAALFLQGMKSEDIESASKPLMKKLDEARAKYGERELFEPLTMDNLFD